MENQYIGVHTCSLIPLNATRVILIDSILHNYIINMSKVHGAQAVMIVGLVANVLVAKRTARDGV